LEYWRSSSSRSRVIEPLLIYQSIFDRERANSNTPEIWITGKRTGVWWPRSVTKPREFQSIHEPTIVNAQFTRWTTVRAYEILEIIDIEILDNLPFTLEISTEP